MSQTLDLLETFQTLSQAMLQAAEDQAWDSLAQLTGERAAVEAQLPEALTAHLLPAEHDSAVRLIQSCLALDKQTFALAEDRRDTIGKLVHALRIA